MGVFGTIGGTYFRTAATKVSLAGLSGGSPTKTNDDPNSSFRAF
jgi:hypothetical protein